MKSIKDVKNLKPILVFAIIIALLVCLPLEYSGVQAQEEPIVVSNTDKRVLSSAYIAPDSLVTDIADCISDARLEETLTYISKGIGTRRVGTSGNAALRDWLVDELQVNGFSEETGTLYTQGFYSAGAYTENVIAIRPAEKENAPIVVLSAHLDTVYGVEGAIDNGSGVALVLEVMRAIRNSNQSRDVELRFIFFSGEEQFFVGANAYINSLSAAERARHAAVFNVDMAVSSNSDVPKALTFSTKGGYIGPEYINGSYAAPVNNKVSAAANRAFDIDSEDVENFYAPINWGSTDLVPFHYADIDASTLSWREIAPYRAVTNYDIAKPAYIHTSMDRLENTEISTLFSATRIAARTLEILIDGISTT